MLPLSPLSLPVGGERPADSAVARLTDRPLLAAILHVDGDTAVLAMAGVRVIARVTSPEQAAWLSSQRTALFVPHWIDEQTLALQWVGPGPNPMEAQDALQVTPNLLGKVLQQLGEPTGPAQQTLAAALLANHLPLTADNLASLATSLAQLTTWGAPEANMAAQLLAKGLAPTPSMITLALATPPPLTASLGQLQDELNAFLAQPGGQASAPQLSQIEQGLAKLIVDWTATPAQLSQQVHGAVAQLGHSLENSLATLVQEPSTPTPPTALAQLTNSPPSALAGSPRADPSILLQLSLLRANLVSRYGETAAPLTRAIDQFLGAVRHEQLGNAHLGPPGGAASSAPPAPNSGAAPNAAPAAERWLGFSFPLAQGQAVPSWTEAHLQIAYQPPENQAERIQLSHTRLVLRVEVDGQPVVVDLSIAGTHVGAQVTLPTTALQHKAERELPSLSAGLAKLGFTLQAAQCSTGEGEPTPARAAPAAISTYA